MTAYQNPFPRNWYKLQTAGGRGLTGILANPSARPGRPRTLFRGVRVSP